MLSNSLEDSLHRSLALANSRKHEFATLEHLLLALTEDEDAVELMRACGINLSELKGLLDKFIDEIKYDIKRIWDVDDSTRYSTFQTP